jgi:hypothetical protein
MRIMASHTTSKAYELLLSSRAKFVTFLFSKLYAVSAFQMVCATDFSDSLIIIHLYDRLA